MIKRWKQRKLVIGEHRSRARRRSWRTYYSRHRARICAANRARYWKDPEHARSVQRRRRRRQFRGGFFAGRRVSAREWVDVRRHYDALRAAGDSCTFQQLAARFKISRWKIQRESSKDGGWAGRARPEKRDDRPS